MISNPKPNPAFDSGVRDAAEIGSVNNIMWT